MGRSDTVGTSGEYTSNVLLYDRIAIQNINSVLKIGRIKSFSFLSTVA